MESYDEPPPGVPLGPLVPEGTALAADPGREWRYRTVVSPPADPASDWRYWAVIPASADRGSDWRYWTIILPCLLTVLAAPVAYAAAALDEVLSVLNSDGSVPGYVSPNGGWIFASVAGAVAAILAALIVSVAPWPRRVRALTVWGIVPLQTGWFVLALYLAGR